MKRKFSFLIWLQALLVALVSNSYLLLLTRRNLIPCFIFVFLAVNIFSGMFQPKTKAFRLKICNHGAVLLCVFVLSVVMSILCHLVLAVVVLPTGDHMPFVYSALLCIGAEAVVFWNGIISVYLTSYQLGIKQRVIGIMCGFLPGINLIILRKFIKTVLNEVDYETAKERLNAQRADQQLCNTKYPLLMVHGVFFRDSKHFNYWGRIPKELESNGATVYYGNHQSADSVADCAAELTERIREIINTTDCEKVNIIAHSKGGLDCRYAMAHLGASPMVASLTTINTPHRGCIFADYLLEKIPAEVKDEIADKYNTTLKKLGDPNPDFLSAVNDLTASRCTAFDTDTPAPEDVYCQSVGSTVKKSAGGKFPLNFSYHLVKHFDGNNDGLVSEQSFSWGENYRLLTPTGDRGISHGDMIDLNRENIEGFDVREFYVELVNDLKNRGL